MADDVPPGAGSEQPEASGRRPDDDENLKNAMAALLGLRSQAPGGASSLSIPPPRRPELRPEPRPDAAGALAADGFAGTEDPGLDDFWSPAHPATGSSEDPVPPSDAPASRLDAPALPLDVPAPHLDAPAPLLDGPDPIVDAPPPVLDAPPPLLDAPDPIVDAPPPVLDAPPPLLDAPDPIIDAPAERVDAPDADLDGRPRVHDGAAPVLDEPDAAAAARAADASAPLDSSADDFWASPAPVVPVDALYTNDAGAGDRSRPSADDRSSVTALQEAGLAGPLNTAMGDLRRLYPDRDDGAPPPLSPTGARSSRSSIGGRGPGLQAWWASRGRELAPGLAVALLVLMAFAVVLIGRGGDDRDSRVDAANRSTTVPPVTTTLPPLEGDPILVPPFEEPGLDEPSESPPAAGPSSSARAGANEPVPAPQRSRPRARAPQPAPAPAPAPAPRAASPAPAPTSPPPTPAPTAPPATSGPPATQAPRSSDPCNNPLFTPEARQRCLDSLGRDGND